MAEFQAAKVRAVSIELREKVLNVYTDITTIAEAVTNWILNSYDANLPLPFDVRTQLDAYTALKIETLKLTDWVSEIRAAQLGDTLINATFGSPIIQTCGLTVTDDAGLEILESGLLITGEAAVYGLHISETGIVITDTGLNTGLTINAE